MKNKKLKKELEISKLILNYLDKIEDSNSILKGDLLNKQEKDFILENMNAFIIGLIADQSVKAELAWSLPYKLANRLGTFDLQTILEKYDICELKNVIREKPALHRYPSKMAEYIYEAIQKIVNEYDCDAKNIWENKSAYDIVNSLEKFKGISHKKASLGTLILVRDLNQPIIDKQNIDIAYDIHIRRLFLRIGLVDEDNQAKILASARQIYPEFPGRLTTAFWTIGREICRPTEPSCLICPVYNVCDKNIEKTKNLK